MVRFFSIVLLLLFSQAAQSQLGYLFVKKGGKKKKVYVEEDRIMLRTNDGKVYYGLITLLQNDTIFINGKPVPVNFVDAVIINPKAKKQFHLSGKFLGLVTAGAALTTAGLTLSKQAKFRQALTAGLVIGFAPILLQLLETKISFSRREYKMGKKFHLQMLEFHMPRKHGF